MKRLWTTVLLMFAVLLPACSAVGMSPEETVRYYFERMAKRDRAGMDSVVAEDHRSADAELDNLKKVELVCCRQETDETAMPYQDGWYDGDAYDTALVRATFRVEYENGGGAGFDNGEYHWYFRLMKDSEDADWRIAMSGV